MKAFFLLNALLFSTLLTSCSTTRAPSVNFLELRSDYQGDSNLIDLEKSPHFFTPNLTKPQEVDIYIHPHETIHGDYFRGGYIRSIIQGSQWEMTKAPPLLKN